MTDASEPPQNRGSVKYVVWVLLLVGITIFLQFAISLVIYVAINGRPNIADWMTMKVPQYDQAALWQDRIWFPMLKMGPAGTSGLGSLVSFDPDRGELIESKLLVPIPLVGLVPDGKRLWAVSSNSVTLVENEQTSEFKPKRLLNRPSTPFLYKQQVAVLDSRKAGLPVLLVLRDNQWDEIGNVIVPNGFMSGWANGKLTLAPMGGSKSGSSLASLLEIQVVSNADEPHVFISSGGVIAYRKGFEFATASALAPSNVDESADLSNLSEWEPITAITPGIRRNGVNWKAGIVAQAPVVTTLLGGSTPFQGAKLQAWNRVDGAWRKIDEQSISASLGLLVVSDGQKTYAAGESLTQFIRFYEVGPNSLQKTKTAMKLSAVPWQKPLEDIGRIFSWCIWIARLILAIGLARLMLRYRDPTYQFGNTSVELATITRRGVARLIDVGLIWIPSYLVTLAFGVASQEQIEQNMEHLFDGGSGSFFFQMMTMLLMSLLIFMTICGLNAFLQAWRGLTLGKWICGIRTVSTTLRHCGFFRAFLRELMLVVDLACGITILPGTLLFSSL